MRKIHEKSIILGIGIGMIITAIAGVIYSAGTSKELTREEIIKLAKGYGMVEQSYIIKNDGSSEKTSSGDKSDSEPSRATPATTPAEQSKATADATVAAAESSVTDNKDSVVSIERDIKVEIKKGEMASQIAEKLLQKGVIADKDEFLNFLRVNNGTTKIVEGIYKFKKNDGLDYIAERITLD